MLGSLGEVQQRTILCDNEPFPAFMHKNAGHTNQEPCESNKRLRADDQSDKKNYDGGNKK